MFTTILESVCDGLIYVAQSVAHSWLYLLLSIILAVAMKVYIDAEKARKLFLRNPAWLIPGSVGTGALTPLCACGTMAVIFSLISSALPWGAIMAFLVSSPLMSPDTFVMISGFMGIKFATILTVASIVIGLAVGYISWIIERKTGFLKNQLKFSGKSYDLKPLLTVPGGCSCGIENPKKAGTSWIADLSIRLKTKEFVVEFYELGIKKVLPLFTVFIFIAYLVKTYVPTEWIINGFDGSQAYSVPLAALAGLPLYVSDATLAPLLKVLSEAGASNGSLMAFWISGPGTSLGVIGGLVLIFKKRALVLYIIYIFLGAIFTGYIVDFVF